MTRRKDGRSYITVHDGILDNPKVEPISDAAFRHLIGLWTTAARGRTGHYISKDSVGRRYLKELEGANLIKADGDRWWLDQELLGYPSNHHARSFIPSSLRKRVYERDNWQCVTCATTEDLSLDHIWPWSMGGDDTYENLQTMCRPCNSSKGAKVPA